MRLHLVVVLAAGPALATGCATQPQAESAPPPVVVIPADPSRDQLNAPDADAGTNTDSTPRKPIIDDPGLQLLHPQ